MITQRWSFFDLLLAQSWRYYSDTIIFKATVHFFLSLISFFGKKKKNFTL